MLQLAGNYEQVKTSNEERKDAPQLDLLALVEILCRRWRVIATVLAIGLVLGAIYLATATRRYTAEFAVLVNSPRASLLAREDSTPDRVMDPGVVESQVEVLKSDGVALTTVRALGLTKDPTVMGDGPGLVSSIIAGIASYILPDSASSSNTPTQEQLEQAAIRSISDTFKVQRVGVTYVISGRYTNINPNRAAVIANGLTNAYLESQMEARYETSRRAADWLQSRLKDLREKTSAAALAVQVFKAENGIVDTARGLITDQQLTDASTRLAAAHSDTDAAKANLDRILQILKSDDAVDATVPDALKDDVLNRLRAQYLDLSSRAADFASRYGSNHGSVVNLRNQMKKVNDAARDELGRIAESLKSTYASAVLREESAKKDMDAAVIKTDVTNKAQVKLRDLESAAQTYRNLYDNMLDKLQSATQEQTSPEDVARVITRASIPDRPSSPKLLIVLVASIAGSLVLGAGLAIAMDLLRRGFKTPDDTRNYAGLECLGTLPLVTVARSTRRALLAAPITSGEIILGSNTPVVRHTLHAPFSRFTETVRGVKVSVDIARRGLEASITGIVSSVPKEGKTTFAANLALVMAQMGHRTLLIDGDFHNPSLTRTLLPKASTGMIEVLEGTQTIENVMVRDSITGLFFVPAVVGKRKPNSVSLLTSTTMSEVLAAARKQFEYVIIDLPPIVPVVDVKAAATMFDHFVFVVEWGRTSREVVRDALLTSEQVRHRVLGVVLNKANVSELKRIESYRGPSYGSYYVESDAA